jgi:gluconolactonase
MGLSPDGRRLYASETYAGRIWRWEVVAPGVLAERTLLYSTGGAHGWDGLAVDGEENICAANLQRGGITVIGRDGQLRTEIVVPENDPFVTNICFGGPDLRQAFITSSGRGKLYQTEWPFPGLRLNFAR